MSAIDRNDIREAALQLRIRDMYREALETATKRLKDFLRKKQQVDEGKIKPPAYYDTPEKVEQWKAGFTRELIRQYRVQDVIMEEICKAGARASGDIRDTIADVYTDTLGEAQQNITRLAGDVGINISFALPNEREVKAIISSNETTFTKLAYKNLGQNVAIRHKLQNALALSSALGEDRKKLMNRISDITGQSEWQARRVAQTERTRAQSQADYSASQEAADRGINMYNEWVCRFRNSRDAHMARHGKWAKQGTFFPGSNMRYPGDHNGSAAETINCYCTMIPHVLLPREKADENGKVTKETET